MRREAKGQPLADTHSPLAIRTKRSGRVSMGARSRNVRYEESLRETVRGFWREEIRDALVNDPIHHDTWTFRVFLVEPTSEEDDSRQTCTITVCTPYILDKFLWPWLLLTKSIDGVARGFGVFMQHEQARTFALGQFLPRLVNEVVQSCCGSGGDGTAFKVRTVWWDDVGKRLNYYTARKKTQ